MGKESLRGFFVRLNGRFVFCFFSGDWVFWLYEGLLFVFLSVLLNEVFSLPSYAVI